jgi:DinB superfamily
MSSPAQQERLQPVPVTSELHNAISAAIAGMTVEELDRHPAGKWSAAQILEHLNLTYVGTIKNLSRRLEQGRPQASGSRLKNFPRRFGLIGLGYFPPGRKSPERVLPRGVPAAQVKDEILENLVKMDRVIAECEARFGRGPVADHPVLGPLTAPEWRKFHLVHGKHHVKQILRLRQS